MRIPTVFPIIGSTGPGRLSERNAISILEPVITDSTILHDCPSDVPTKSSGMARLFAAGSMWFAVSKLGRLSGVRVAALIRRRE